MIYYCVEWDIKVTLLACSLTLSVINFVYNCYSVCSQFKLNNNVALFWSAVMWSVAINDLVVLNGNWTVIVVLYWMHVVRSESAE